ncbi:MAG: 30S ribosomal protein S16 [Angustibacter sp.]
MAVKIRLKRLGKIRAPFYRVVIADSRTKRDGRSIEEIGRYHPTHDPSVIEIDSDRAQYWLGVGAQPTEQVLALLKITGDWQRFKGLPGAEGTLRTADPRPDRAAAFDEAAKSAGGDDVKDGATTAKKRAAKQGTAKKTADSKAADKKASGEKASGAGTQDAASSGDGSEPVAGSAGADVTQDVTADGEGEKAEA